MLIVVLYISATLIIVVPLSRYCLAQSDNREVWNIKLAINAVFLIYKEQRCPISHHLGVHAVFGKCLFMLNHV